MSTNVRQPLVKLALYIRNCIAKQETICPHVVARILNLVLTPPIDFDVPTTALDTFRTDSINFCESVIQTPMCVTTPQAVAFYKTHSSTMLQRRALKKDTELHYYVLDENLATPYPKRYLPPSLETYAKEFADESSSEFTSQSTDMESSTPDDVEVECDESEEILDSLNHITNSLASLTQTIALLQTTMLSMHNRMEKSNAIQCKHYDEFSRTLKSIRETSRKVQAGNIANRAKLNLPFYLRKHSIEASNLKSYNHDPKTGAITGVTLKNPWTQNLSGGTFSTL
jgi:hypothetical protein